eukprot:GHVU01223689.1.p2 GENE.GHVU01223689.1~~GHVU01223689.1.p2  ORF type:complete len:108 (+),score=2.67 GHVU01223689.1:1001-1324(+)
MNRKTGSRRIGFFSLAFGRDEGSVHRVVETPETNAKNTKTILKSKVTTPKSYFEIVNTTLSLRRLTPRCSAAATNRSLVGAAKRPTTTRMLHLDYDLLAISLTDIAS